MKALTLIANEKRNGFSTKSDFTRAKLAEWLKKYKHFSVVPKVTDSVKGRRYLEGATVPAYCEWQYGIPAAERGRGEARRDLFKRDFHYDIVKNRKGEPTRIPLSTVGFVNDVSTRYTEWAEQNGAPIPNPALFKLWRDQYSMDLRFEDFYDWLDFLGIDESTMPSKETLSKLDDDY